jgi:hypothetical protein
MRISVPADEGDEVSISADFISVEQATVTLEIESTFYNSQAEPWRHGFDVGFNARLSS